MRNYELVLVMQASLTAAEKTWILSSIEEILGKDTIQEKDDIGVLESAYLLENNKENNYIHLVSYYLKADPSKLKEYESEISFVKGLIRFFFYSMKDNQEFTTYAAMQEKLTKFLEAPKKKTEETEEQGEKEDKTEEKEETQE